MITRWEFTVAMGTLTSVRYFAIGRQTFEILQSLRLA
jgi:hypothetical protein